MHSIIKILYKLTNYFSICFFFGLNFLEQFITVRPLYFKLCTLNSTQSTGEKKGKKKMWSTGFLNRILLQM